MDGRSGQKRADRVSAADDENESGPAFLDNIEKYASAAGYEVMLRITRESQLEESKVISSFLKQGVDGMIIFRLKTRPTTIRF